MRATHKDVIETVGIETIIEAIAKGEQQTAIAARIGVPPQSLSRYVRLHPDYAAAIDSHHLVRLDNAEKAHDDAIARNDYELARARYDNYKLKAHRAAVASPTFRDKQDAQQGVQIQVIVAPQAAIPTVTVDAQRIDNAIDAPQHNNMDC